MSNFRLHPETIHKAYWAPPRQGLAVKGKLTHRPSGLSVEFFSLSRIADAERTALIELTNMVRRDIGRGDQ